MERTHDDTAVMVDGHDKRYGTLLLCSSVWQTQGLMVKIFGSGAVLRTGEVYNQEREEARSSFWTFSNLGKRQYSHLYPLGIRIGHTSNNLSTLGVAADG